MKRKQFSKEEKEEIVAYGIERGKIAVISIIVALIIGKVLGIFFQSVEFIIVFWVLRRYAGGYHADSQTKCYGISFFALICSYWAIKYAKYNIAVCFLLQLICLFIMGMVAPVECKNRKLEDWERTRYRRRTRRNSVVLFAFSCYCYGTSKGDLINIIVTANLLVTISLLAGIIKNYYGLAIRVKEGKVTVQPSG